MRRPLWLAFGLLTRLRVPAVEDPTDRELGAAVGWFPLVGLVVGLTMWAADTAARWAVGPLAGAVVAVAAAVWLTGALHLDGLIDTCDGCLPPLDPEERRRAMHDPGVGAFGLIGALLVLALKVVLLAELAGCAHAAGLILAPVLGRWVMALAIHLHPAAPGSAMGATFARRPAVADWLTATCTAAAAAFWLLPAWRAWAVLALALAVGYLLAARLARQLDGLTGDTYGALCETGEVVALAAIIAAQSLPA